MGKIIFFLILIILLFGCTTIQREYLIDSEPIDSIYLESSGFIGFVIGIFISSLGWYVHNKLYEVQNEF